MNDELKKVMIAIECDGMGFRFREKCGGLEFSVGEWSVRKNTWPRIPVSSAPLPSIRCLAVCPSGGVVVARVNRFVVFSYGYVQEAVRDAT